MLNALAQYCKYKHPNSEYKYSLKCKRKFNNILKVLKLSKKIIF